MKRFSAFAAAIEKGNAKTINTKNLSHVSTSATSSGAPGYAGFLHLGGDTLDELIKLKALIQIARRETDAKLELHGLEKLDQPFPAGKSFLNSTPLFRRWVREEGQKPIRIVQAKHGCSKI